MRVRYKSSEINYSLDTPQPLTTASSDTTTPRGVGWLGVVPDAQGKGFCVGRGVRIRTWGRSGGCEAGEDESGNDLCAHIKARVVMAELEMGEQGGWEFGGCTFALPHLYTRTTTL